MNELTFDVPATFPSGLDLGAFNDELRYDFSFIDFSLSLSGDVLVFGSVDPLTQGQLDALNDAIAAHTGISKPFEKKHYEQEYFNTRIIRDTWWARSSGDVLSLKVEETLYTYSGSRMMGETKKTYNRDGSVASTKSWMFKQEKVGNVLRVRKVEQ